MTASTALTAPPALLKPRSGSEHKAIGRPPAGWPSPHVRVAISTDGGGPVALRSPMVLKTHRQLYVVELLLAASVCLLMALSASEFVPAVPADLGEVPTAQAAAPDPDGRGELPGPDGHGALHTLSLCIAVVVMTCVLAFVRAPLPAAGHVGRPPAGPATRASSPRTLRLSPPSLVTEGVLLRV